MHFEVLVPLLCLCALIGIQRQKFWITSISLCFFLGIKEDLSIYLAALAIVLIPTDKKRHKEWVFVLLYAFFIIFSYSQS
ncbi:membrane protein, PF09852 family [Leptospira weilii serovar Topaz str. LT2116]|uniref:Membrane protein, PF09852 family n=1 Tax=Leptospira weilii serovar Topaz str. LT2116 TaxID=1088540 RepID=M3EMT7_9LEPT|nr:membrane protein, PF09852 family [Leptospira weilii serovar Topaz str. LT2116]